MINRNGFFRKFKRKVDDFLWEMNLPSPFTNASLNKSFQTNNHIPRTPSVNRPWVNNRVKTANVNSKFKHDPRYIQFDEKPLYEKRGWTKIGNTYKGYYRTKYGAWKGEITRRGDKFDVFIFNPPRNQLENHSRWVCFHDEGGGKYYINLALNPKDKSVDSIIFYVERIIYESFELF